MHKTRHDGKTVTAGDLLNSTKREQIMQTNIGWTDLKQLRGSPQYHEQGKRDLFAMLRQLGVPTFFLTNSMADTRWVEFLQALSWAVDKKMLT
jgi:hypothetical protein